MLELIAIPGMKCSAYCYTFSDALCSCYTWSEALCPLLYLEWIHME